MTEMGKIVVTGAQGYLGAKIVDALESWQVPVISLSRRSNPGMLRCNLLDGNETYEVLTSLVPSQIIHCAAYTPKNMTDYQSEAVANKNSLMIDNVLASSSCPLIYISSMTVYGEQRSVKRYEENAGAPSSEYGRGKWRDEKTIEAAGRTALAIRLPGLFGPPREGGIVANLIRHFRDGTKISLPDRPQLWAGMHVDDAAVAVATLAASEVKGFQAINIAYRDTYSISYLVDIVAEIFGRPSSGTIRHPEFEFSLEKAECYGAVPGRNLKDAIHDIRYII